MCTTYLISEFIKEFSEYDVIGYPRLVRLNPMIPWKTRGNGALCLQLGVGTGRRFLIGELEGKKYYGYLNSKEAKLCEDVAPRIERIVSKYGEFDDPNTNPAFVISDRKPLPRLYWATVRKIVELNKVIKILDKIGAIYKGYKNKRGLIGAAAALSWRPKDKTYEVITYREKAKWGTKRDIDEHSVIEMDRKIKSTFNNYDYLNRHICIAPNSPCPILYGIRGENQTDLLKAMKLVRSEKIDRWLLYLTNQGTDEHLQKSSIRNIKPYQSVILDGEVISYPKTILGGHVIFEISDSTGKIDCAAYEPSKQFRNVVRELVIGDAIRVYGGVRGLYTDKLEKYQMLDLKKDKPRTINIEKLKIFKLMKSVEKVGNPICPSCRNRMKSIGKGQGYRCKKCGTKTTEKDAEYAEMQRFLKEIFYEPPASARRHLSKPLKRMGVYNDRI